MTNGLSSASLDFSGDAAVEQAIAVLQRFEDDDQFNNVRIELNTSWDHKTQDTRQAKLEPVEEDQNKEKEKETTEKEQISAGTSHHKVLTGIFDIGANTQIPVTRVIGNLDIPDGTVYAAMSTLYDRGLVSREKGPQGNYLYTLTDFGESELERLGRAEN